MAEKKDTKFKPGQSGNPAGRPAGSGWVMKAREELQKAWDGVEAGGKDGIRHQLIAKAREGDMGAIRLVAERVCPPMKAAEPTAEIELQGETLTDKAMGVLAALGLGKVAPGQASQLLQGLGALAKIVETDELSRRIAALEERSK